MLCSVKMPSTMCYLSSCQVHRLLHMVMQDSNKPDSDNALGCSAEVSNTDSSRGASEDGDGLHPPYPPPHICRTASAGPGHHPEGEGKGWKGGQTHTATSWITLFFGQYQLVFSYIYAFNSFIISHLSDNCGYCSYILGSIIWVSLWC